MTQVETLSPDPSLTGREPQENKDQIVEPTKDNVSPEDKNWQAALQKKAELLKAREAELEETKRRLKEKEDQERSKKLSELSEVDRYKSIAEEESRKRGQSEMKSIVTEALSGKQIPAPIVELLKSTPWAIPEVRKELGEDFTWDDAIESVRRHLPDYIDSLVVNSPTKSEESNTKVDSERSIGETVITSGHIYTQREVAELSKNPKEYEKHRDAIFRQLEKSGGRLPEY